MLTLTRIFIKNRALHISSRKIFELLMIDRIDEAFSIYRVFSIRRWPCFYRCNHFRPFHFLDSTTEETSWPTWCHGYCNQKLLAGLLSCRSRIEKGILQSFMFDKPNDTTAGYLVSMFIHTDAKVLCPRHLIVSDIGYYSTLLKFL